MNNIMKLFALLIGLVLGTLLVEFGRRQITKKGKH